MATEEDRAASAAVACSACKGSGEVECPDCHGNGLFTCNQGCHEVTCQRCEEAAAAPCKRCDGSGEEPPGTPSASAEAA